MKTNLFLAILAAGMGGALADSDGQPAPTNLGQAAYPRIAVDGRVTFRLQAPNAGHVRLEGGAGLVKEPLALAKDDQGVWSVTTPPAVPGFHYYWFTVDGLRVNDPASSTFFGWGRDTSGIEVPDPGADFYAAKQDVPHGEVRVHGYFSKITGRWRRAHVYTPPGYDEARRKRYPVLYLLHGAGENERGWIEQGRANLILDNLVAKGEARPMILVVDSGYASYPSTDAANSSRRTAGATAAFEEVMLTELIPGIDARYRTSKHREDRAMAGLSMGGVQTLDVALRHLDRFAWIGAMSGVPRQGFDATTAYEGVFRDAESFGRKVRLLWLGAGTAEAEVHSRVRSVHETLGRAGIESVFYSSNGTDHEWQTWRRCLRDFAPRLFRRRVRAYS